MQQRTLSYFTSDVHLGLQAFDPDERERRFVSFLSSIPRERTEALYLLGDIWDFWYEWKYTVPKGYIRVFSQIQDLIDKGVKVFFFQGNHDVWSYSYFEELGMIRLIQPSFVEIGGKTFCLGHGDALGKCTRGYRVMRHIFHSKVTQWMFSTLLHPTVAMAIGRAWSRNNRLSRRSRYIWKGSGEPIMEYARKVLSCRKVDYFVFGHFHVKAEETLSGGAKLIMLNSWIYQDDWFLYDSSL